MQVVDKKIVGDNCYIIHLTSVSLTFFFFFSFIQIFNNGIFNLIRRGRNIKKAIAIHKEGVTQEIQSLCLVFGRQQKRRRKKREQEGVSGGGGGGDGENPKQQQQQYELGFYGLFVLNTNGNRGRDESRVRRGRNGASPPV